MLETIIIIIVFYFLGCWSAFFAIWIDNYIDTFPLSNRELIPHYWRKLTIFGKIVIGTYVFIPAVAAVIVVGTVLALLRLFKFLFIKR